MGINQAPSRSSARRKCTGSTRDRYQALAQASETGETFLKRRGRGLLDHRSRQRLALQHFLGRERPHRPAETPPIATRGLTIAPSATGTCAAMVDRAGVERAAHRLSVKPCVGFGDAKPNLGHDLGRSQPGRDHVPHGLFFRTLPRSDRDARIERPQAGRENSRDAKSQTLPPTVAVERRVGEPIDSIAVRNAASAGWRSTAARVVKAPAAPAFRQ